MRGRPPSKVPATPISRRVEKRMREIGMTRAELAEKLGLAVGTLHNRITASEFRASDILPLARILQAPVRWLLTGRLPVDGESTSWPMA